MSVNQIKSKERVANHGEVFTPTWMVEAMLDLVKDETERIDSRLFGEARDLHPIQDLPTDDHQRTGGSER